MCHCSSRVTTLRVPWNSLTFPVTASQVLVYVRSWNKLAALRSQFWQDRTAVLLSEFCQNLFTTSRGQNVHNSSYNGSMHFGTHSRRENGVENMHFSMTWTVAMAFPSFLKTLRYPPNIFQFSTFSRTCRQAVTLNKSNRQSYCEIHVSTAVNSLHATGPPPYSVHRWQTIPQTKATNKPLLVLIADDVRRQGSGIKAMVGNLGC